MKRYMIDGCSNGYILTIKEGPEGKYIGKYVYTTLSEVFEQIEFKEKENGKT